MNWSFRIGKVPFVMILLLGPACGESGCVNTVEARVPSPNGRWEAVVYQRACGATTGPSAQVALVPKNEPLPDKPGNVFVSEDNPKVIAEWTDADALTVTYERASRVSRREALQAGVVIQYRTFPTDTSEASAPQ
jgi:hypothetical protein